MVQGRIMAASRAGNSCRPRRLAGGWRGPGGRHAGGRGTGRCRGAGGSGPGTARHRGACCAAGRHAAPPATNVPALLRAAEAGDPKAQFDLADRYLDGRGVAADDEAAARWFLTAAEGGYAPAQYNMSLLYLMGRGVAPDEAAALRWLRASAVQGLPEAQNRLGGFYAQGVAVARNDEEAARWFRLAAMQGDPPAQHNLGGMYYTGTACRRMTAWPPSGPAWRRRRVTSRLQFYLGTLYAEGQGVAADPVQALKWARWRRPRRAIWRSAPGPAGSGPS
ncbi:MAG: tetratricopeptide repeat protein [Geminicoccaceae bacterium]